MTTIRTTCPQCGEVDMGPEQILLCLRHGHGEGVYRFSCPECRDTVEKPADRRVVALLLSAGVEMEEDEGERLGATVPRVAVLEERPGGPPFTVDDLLLFRALLEDEGRLYQALPRE